MSPLVGEDTPGQPDGIAGEHLVEPLRPAGPLIPGISEGGRLLIVEDGLGVIGDAQAVGDGGSRELNILCEQMPFPAPCRPQHLICDEEARARYRTGGVEREPRLVQELRLPQEPNTIACRYPVGIEVLGVTIARRGLRATVEGLVHLTEVVRIQHIISVEDEVGLMTRIGELAPDGLQAVIQSVALPHQFLIEPLEHGGSGITRHLRRVICAVIGDDEDIYELLRIALGANGGYQVRYDRAFVPSRNEDCVLVILGCGGLGSFPREDDEDIVELIGIANSESEEDAEIEDVDERQRRHRLRQFLEHISPSLQGPSLGLRANAFKTEADRL